MLRDDAKCELLCFQKKEKKRTLLENCYRHSSYFYVFDKIIIIIFIYPRMIVPGILTNIKMFSEKRKKNAVGKLLSRFILFLPLDIIEVAKRIPN